MILRRDYYSTKSETAFVKDLFKIINDDSYAYSDTAKADMYFLSDNAPNSTLDPELYGDTVLMDKRERTLSEEYMSIRSFKALKANIDRKIKTIAIGKSAKIACIMAGGDVIQTVFGHRASSNKDRRTTHSVKSLFGEYEVSSHHFDMMYPFSIHPDKYSILGYAESESEIAVFNKDERATVEEAYLNNKRVLIPPTLREYFGGSTSKRLRVEPEIVFFREIGVLAIEHETCIIGNSTKEKLKKIVDLFLNDKL